MHVTALTTAFLYTPDQSSVPLTQTMTHSSRSVTGMCPSEAGFLNVSPTSYTLTKNKNNFKIHHRKFQLKLKEINLTVRNLLYCSWMPEHNKHSLPWQSFVCNVSLKSHQKQVKRKVKVIQILRGCTKQNILLGSLNKGKQFCDSSYQELISSISSSYDQTLVRNTKEEEGN